MTLTKAQSIVDKLAKQFGVDPPLVNFKRKYKGRFPASSDYVWLDQTIRLAGWDSTEFSLLHEFTHHLCWINMKHVTHGSKFYWMLVAVIMVYYNGNYTSRNGGYSWANEYINGKKFYKKLLKLSIEEILANIVK